MDTYRYLVDAAVLNPNVASIDTNDASSLEVCLSPFAIVILIVTPLAFEHELVQSIDRPNCVRRLSASQTIVAHRKWHRNQATYKCHCHTMDAQSLTRATMMTLNPPATYPHCHHPYRCNSSEIRYYHPDPISNRLSYCNLFTTKAKYQEKRKKE